MRGAVGGNQSLLREELAFSLRTVMNAVSGLFILRFVLDEFMHFTRDRGTFTVKKFFFLGFHV